MTLRLRIVSEQRRLLGERSVFVLAAAGATIGRSAENDWVLPDPQRYVSARHARICFRDGAYLLEDLSTNGSYVNDSAAPLGREAQHPLRNGDLIRLGEYQIAVVLEAEPQSASPDHDNGAASGVPTSINALHSVGRVAQTDIGAPLNLNELLVVEEPVLSSAPRPAPGAESILGDEPTDSAIQRRIARLAKAVERQPRLTGGAGSVGDLQSGLHAFCRGAGIAPDRLPAEAHSRLMHLAGLLLREALVGVRDLDRSRNEIRNQYRISLPTDPEDPRTSLAGLTVDELILTLFHRHELRSMDAVQWLRETMSSAKDHESAMARAMRTAFVEFLDRLDPAELEARFERAARRGDAKARDRSRFWDLYTEFYRNLIEMPVDHLPHTFIEAFARAYQESLKKDPPERAQASQA